MYDYFVVRFTNRQDGTKILNLAVRANGQIQVYSTKPITSWYRTYVTIPYSS